ncbi:MULTISPECIES: hypothetical protein [Halobacterium]|uniref:COG1470 family protein n=1 Tax=Halobacterium TaxID=2239 RepID=UPI000AD371F3|nr:MULTISPECIES: hypothetical protein [Halobacterium]MCG1003560.1 hypothetical protein [Halobacterium noricense]
MASKGIILTVLVVCLVVVPPATSVPIEDNHKQSENSCVDAAKHVATEKKPGVGLHVTYTIQFSKHENRICVNVENKGEMKVSSAFGLLVDDTGFSPKMPDLESGESKSISDNITPYLSVAQDNHTVSVNAGGQEFDFNFTQNLNASSPETSTPYIKNIQLVRRGNQTKLFATVHNPGKRAYGIHVRAETFGTEGEFEIGAPQPGNTSEFRLDLNEGPGEVVAGKVMVYDDYNQSAGKFDQKEFLAKPNETANAWDDDFEQVPGGTADVSYSNETARQYREGYVDDEALSPFQRRAGAVLVVVVLVGAVLWRRR